MQRKFLITALCALVFLPGTAHALKCVPPVLNEESYAKAELIFEGVAKSSQTKNTVIQGRRAKSKIHEFDVTRLWKGDAGLEKVTVAGDPDWGMDFTPGKPYLVIAKRTKEKPGYIIPVCSYTRGIEAAGTGLKFLNNTKRPIQE